MTSPHLGLLVALAAGLLAEAAHGQAPPALASGAHVRIAAPTLGWDGKTGTLTEVRGDTLVVRTRGILFRATRVPASAIAKLEVSRNHSGHQLALGVGVLIGGTLGALGGYALRSPCRTSGNLDFSCMWSGMGEGLLGGAVGAGLGALLGAALVPERWSSVALGGPRVGLVLRPGSGVGLGVALVF